MLIQDIFVPLVFHSMITRGHSCDKGTIPYMIIYINAKKIKTVSYQRLNYFRPEFTVI